MDFRRNAVFKLKWTEKLSRQTKRWRMIIRISRFLRASSRNASEQDADLKALTQSVESEDNRPAFELLRSIAELASPDGAFAADWGHSNVRYWLWNSEAGNQSVAYTAGQLLRASTI